MMGEADSELFEEDDMRHPAYHLRTNKAVDRLLLVSVIRKLDPEGKEFTYYSFGGPFLEDLRIMDHFFPEMKLVSLESNMQTFKRQTFNTFSSRVKLWNKPFQEFLANDYDPQTKDVIWLDYTDLSYQVITEFQTILKKVMPGSVIRITVNAEAEVDLKSIKNKLSTEEYGALLKRVVDDFSNQYDKVLTIPVDEDTFTKPSNYAHTIQSMFRHAASLALESTGSSIEYIPLQTTRYSDGTQMLSITGIVSEKNAKERLLERLGGIRLPNFDWHEPDRIDVPALSLKERLHLEPLLPVAPGADPGEILFRALDYFIDKGEAQTRRQLAHYADCQREFPNFIRMM